MSAKPTAAEWLRVVGGRASFARFMEAALYDPGHGYYSRQISAVGKRGDFSTSATLDPSFAQSVAAWIEESWKELGMLPLIEAGAGDGSLAAGILRSLPWWRRWRTSYHIVDLSGPLIALQQKRLGRRAVWHGSMEEALKACGGRALIFSNELADAFPCRLLRKTESGWEEIYLRLCDGCVCEEGEPLPPEIWADWSACSPGLSWKTGQRVEIQDSFRAWMSSWAPAWQRGRMLLIDYGAEVEKLYWRRPDGTLRAYFSHLRLEGADVYARMGRQDLTADVNFTDLRKWGEDLGLKTKGLRSQAEFIGAYVQSEKPRRKEAATFLQDPSGAGEAFLVLEQERL